MFLKSDPSMPISGLVVIAKAHQAPVGLPHPTPSAALEWYGKRIRGLSHEQWHDNPDGTVVRGWHEHLWSPQEQDAHVIQARPEPTRKELLDILKWGLRSGTSKFWRSKMTSVIESVLDTYLDTYRSLIVTERLGRSIVISFPFHLAANHRIEITVTDFGEDFCIISDSAKTLGEVQSAGYSLTSQMKEKLERLVSLSGIRITDSHLVLQTSYKDLGISIQKFLEMAKTIGDVYLVHKPRETSEDDLISEVRTILDSERLPYKLHQKIPGELEDHPFDVVVPTNGRAGLAVSILNGQNTHTVAQIWGFKCDDIRRGEWYHRNRSKLALIYDVRYQTWSEASRTILQSRADIALPSDSVGDLRVTLSNGAKPGKHELAPKLKDRDHPEASLLDQGED
jgi:hypothetical protein